MKIFDHFNQGGNPCPICNTRDDKPCTLAGIDGTGDGKIVEAMALHIDCLQLTAYIRDGKCAVADNFAYRIPE